jgi:uncharacterized SAM-binding protein YcdF (DUF218 family)
MSWFLTNLFSALLLPPLSFFLLLFFAYLIKRKKPLASKIIIGGTLLIAWLLTTPYIAESLLHTLESPPITQPYHNIPEAIIVLGGGTYSDAPEYAGDTVSSATLTRLRYAAKLHQNIHLPIITSGGTPLGNKISEAQLMKIVLEQEFNTPVKWVEGSSNNTLESARLSFKLLQQNNIKCIFLVTHAWHMARAAKAFETAGFVVIPAPTAYSTRYNLDLLAFLPSSSALQDSQIFLHEMIGMIWYRLKS